MAHFPADWRSARQGWRRSVASALALWLFTVPTGAAHRGRGVGLGYIVEVAQHDRDALPRRKAADREEQEVVSLAAHTVVGRCFREHRRRHFGVPPRGPPVEGLVDHDPAHVGVRAVVGADAFPVRPGTHQGGLHQVLGGSPVAGQQPRGPQQRPLPGKYKAPELLRTVHQGPLLLPHSTGWDPSRVASTSSPGHGRHTASGTWRAHGAPMGSAGKPWVGTGGRPDHRHDPADSGMSGSGPSSRRGFPGG